MLFFVEFNMKPNFVKLDCRDTFIDLRGGSGGGGGVSLLGSIGLCLLHRPIFPFITTFGSPLGRTVQSIWCYESMTNETKTYSYKCYYNMSCTICCILGVRCAYLFDARVLNMDQNNIDT